MTRSQSPRVAGARAVPIAAPNPRLERDDLDAIAAAIGRTGAGSGLARPVAS